jgi:hypothetical protein
MKTGRRRGPHKGDGGRPKSRYRNDPDRFVVTLALALEKPDSDQAALLKLADMLLCGAPNVVVEPPERVKTGYAGFSIGNIAGERLSDSRSEARSRTASPEGNRLWRSRLATLKRKMRAYQLERDDGQWLGASLFGLQLLLAGDGRLRIVGQEILRLHGWRERVDRIERLLSRLSRVGEASTRIPVETHIMRHERSIFVMTRHGGEASTVFRVEQAFRLV